MKLIGILITVTLLSALFVWWISLTLNRTDEAIITTQQVEQPENSQVIQGNSPLDYSKQQTEKINEINIERAEEINQLP